MSAMIYDGNLQQERSRSTRGKISYDGEVDGIPLVSRTVYSLAYEQPGQRVPKPESLDVYVVESISTDPPPPEDFTLAAFGVRKPGSKTESGEGWFLLASVAILAIFCFGCFGLRRIVAAA